MFPSKTTVADPNASSVPAQGTTGAQGVSSQGTTQSGAADAGESLDDLKSKLMELEMDRRRQQSVYDQKIEQEKRRFNQQVADLQRQVDEARTSGMDEAQKRAYEAQRLAEQNAELRSQLETFQQTQAQQQMMGQWRDYYVSEFGLDARELDMTSQETLIASGMEAIRNRLQGVAPQLRQPSQPPAPTAPKVLTGQGSAPQVRVTLEDIRKSLSSQTGRNLTMDDVFSLADRGAIDLKAMGLL